MKRLIAVGLVLLVGAGLLFGFRARAESARGPTIEGERITVTRGELVATVNATGNVEAAREIALAFRSGGPLVELAVEPGDRITDDQLLARLEATDLELAVAQAEAQIASQQAQIRRLEAPPTEADLRAAEAQIASAQANLDRLLSGSNPQDITSARAQVSAAQAALAQLDQGPNESQVIAAQAELDRAEAQLRQAQAAYDRVKDRPEISMLPQSLELEQATIAYTAAQANYDALFVGPTAEQVEQARANVVQAQANLNRLLEGNSSADIEAARSALVQAESNLELLRQGVDENELDSARAVLRQNEIALEQAQNNLESAELRAPFDATVAEVGAEVGEILPAAQPVVTLADLSTLEINVEVDEIDIGRIAVGDEATITVDSLPDRALAGIIDFIAPLPTINQGVVTYPVRIVLEGDQIEGLRVGMSANVDIVAEVRDGVLLIPSRAIEIDRTTGDLFVERLRGETTERVPVTVGLRSESSYEVRSGVEEGDTLLIRPIDRRQSLFGNGDN